MLLDKIRTGSLATAKKACIWHRSIGRYKTFEYVEPFGRGSLV